MLQTIVVPLDAVLALSGTPVIQPGIPIRSVFFPSIPAGVSVEMAFEQKFSFPVSDGQSYDFECDQQMRGLWLVTGAAFAGQSITIVVGTGDGGMQVTTG